MKRIYLIDCPGVVPPNNNDSEEDILLRGVVRVENVENPEQYIAAILKRTQPRHIQRTYAISSYTDHIDFLSILARKGGRLLKAGEPDLDGVAKMVINDFLRGKIPWFTPPPFTAPTGDDKVDGREGRLGEMGRKRKIDDTVTEASKEPTEAASSDVESESDEEFEGFNDNDSGEESDNGVKLSDETHD
jgi:nuclear GTP-binding protein